MRHVALVIGGFLLCSCAQSPYQRDYYSLGMDRPYLVRWTQGSPQ